MAFGGIHPRCNIGIQFKNLQSIESVKYFPDFPMQLSKHCSVQLPDNSIFMYGGVDGNGKVSYAAFQLFMSKYKWIQVL